jgi:sulfonate transport system ATP-binding protein
MLATALRRVDVRFDRPPPVGPYQTEPPRGVSLKLRGLTKRFTSKDVLRGITLDVPAGQFLTIVGRSGCGKSTLLRLLVGLDAPSTGEIALDDTRPPRSPARIMFQEPRLLPWASVLANVEVGLTANRHDGEGRAKALQILDQVGLADRANEWPAVLSGGQKQRVALARALVSAPGLLVLDEPLGALDALTRIEMQTLLEEVWRAQGFTAVLVTHDVAEALALGDRVVVIEDGCIALDLEITLPRPRHRGGSGLAALEGRILDQLLEPHLTSVAGGRS